MFLHNTSAWRGRTYDYCFFVVEYIKGIHEVTWRGHDKVLVIFLILFYYTVMGSTLFGQSESVTINSDSLENTVFFLASEELAGRAAGTTEDSIAAFYIANRLREYGMVPLLGDSYVIPFELTLYREADSLSTLVLGDSLLVYGRDYTLHPYSPVMDVSGKLVDVTSNDTIRGDIAFLKISSDSVNFITTDLVDRGFRAVLYYDPDNEGNFDRCGGVEFPVPVVALNGKFSGLTSETGSTEVELSSRTFSVKGVSYNVAAITPYEAEEYVMIGAHYDHLGFGGKNSGSLLPDTMAVHPGADDNASGVASILEIARTLNVSETGKGMAIVAFGAEERGLVGSAKLSDTLRSCGLLPELMINLDMVGRLRNDKLKVGGMATFENSDSLLNALNRDPGFNLIFSGEGTGPSDHSSFYSKKVPVLYFTTGVHFDYHKPSDKAFLIDFDGLKRVTLFISNLARELTEGDLEVVYKGGAGSSHKNSRHKRDFKVTLGIIPDFTYEKGDGFCIGPVNEGGAAYKAGLMEGDVITSLGGVSVRNIYDYMKALKGLKKGERVVAVIVRNGSVKKVMIDL